MKAFIVDGYTTDLSWSLPVISYPGTRLKHLVLPEQGLVITPYRGTLFVNPDAQKILDYAATFPRTSRPVEVELDADLAQAIETFLDGQRLLAHNLTNEGSEFAGYFAELFNQKRPAAESTAT